jgi:manganese-dependent inorganic pyrophosphatase
VNPVVGDPIYVVGHRHPDTDSIASAIAYAHLKRTLGDSHVLAARAGELNAETRYVLDRLSLATPELLTHARGRRVILVDHNEVAQAVDEIRQATVIEIWEHHRMGDLEIPGPIVFHCEPVGATATLIAEQYFIHNVAVPPPIAALLLAAILSDTLGFASPTCSQKDRDIAQRLEAISGLEASTFGRELMAARGDVTRRSVRDLIESDFKEFTFTGNRVGIAKIESPDVKSLLPRRQEFLEELRRVRAEKTLLQVILLLTDIGRKGSYVWFAGDRADVLERALGRPLIEGAAYVEDWMSRKKQVVPLLKRAFANSTH